MNVFIENQSSYIHVQVQALGNKWSVMQVSGKHNYINIRKDTNNPFGGPGKDFPNWDAAQAHYKSPLMKAAIILAQSEINQPL